MQTRALIPTWTLVVVSCCAALVAFALVYVSFTQTREVFAVNPYCATPAGYMFFVRPMIQRLQTAWLISGAAGLLSWSCAFVARGRVSASTRGLGRTTTALLWLSSLAIVGCALAFGWYRLACYFARFV